MRSGARNTPEPEAEAEMHVAIDLAVEHDVWTQHLSDLPAGHDDGIAELEALAKRAVTAALAQVGALGIEPSVPSTGTELSIVLGDDAFIRTLNAQWRGKDAPTNVLSFPSPKAMRAMTLGDIVVAYETSAREAAERGMPLADYLTHLIVHGVLHLLGHDHEDDAEADSMEALESRALSALGIASPYEGFDETARGDAAGLCATS